MPGGKMNSIFPVHSINRDDIHWEDYQNVLTPVEEHKGIWFKREDFNAPLGYHGPNGSKMRQLVYLMMRQREGKTHVLTGASIQSPQLSMAAIVGAHLGLTQRTVVYSKPHTVLTHANPRIASGFGAKFEYAKAPYNPQIQSVVKSLMRDDSLYVPYGISLNHKTYPASEILDFHNVGAHQMENLPDNLDRLIMPAGSCNSLCSALLGLSRNSHGLKQLFMIGIGPEKMKWVSERMEVMGVNVKDLPFDIRYVNLQTLKYSSYSDKFKGETWGDIAFHPTYEAKMIRWLRENDELHEDGRSCFWIVGAEGKVPVIEPFFTHEIPAVAA
jgi:hypothetical protein